MPFVPALGVALGATAGTAGATILGATAIATGVGAVATGIGAIQSSRQAKKARQAQETRLAEPAKRRTEDIVSGIEKAPEAARGIAQEETKRKLRRRTRTVLTPDLGAFRPKVAKKTLLGE